MGIISDVETAIYRTRLFNSMSLDRVVKLVKEECNIEISKEQVEEWRYTGLNNVDFLKVYTMGLMSINTLEVSESEPTNQ